MIRPRRSLLFAPANRPAVHGKALASGADIVCLDLEDAVPPAGKADARPAGLAHLVPAPGPERALRINSPRSAAGLADLLAILEARPEAGTILIPKVADPFELRLADEILTEAALPLRLAVLIESAEGLEKAPAILAASPRIDWALFGAVDYAAEMGVAVADEPLAWARGRLLHAARLAGVDLLDVPSLDFRNEGAVAAEAARARALGFAGKAAIHPATLPAIHAAFTPSPEEIARAARIVAAFEAAPGGLAVLDGKLVERPVVRAAQGILALGAALQPEEGA